MVDGSRLVMRISGKFSASEASPGDGVSLNVGLLSLLPLDFRLAKIQVCTGVFTQSTIDFLILLWFSSNVRRLLMVGWSIDGLTDMID